MKQGYPLREIAGFDARVLHTLRDAMSVTTAEEFLHAASAYPMEVARLLGTDVESVSEYAEAAATVLGTDEAGAILDPPEPAYRFRTGQDAPAGETF